jgi:outer membrane protein assembly factor BamD (BamD/ComL family)
MVSRLYIFVFAFAASAAFALPQPGPGSMRYATDAFPGFDSESEIISLSKKEPRLFSWFFSPEKSTAEEQLKFCESLEAEKDWDDAISEYDALVRYWPFSKEAPVAQRRIADIYLANVCDTESAIREFIYLLDFYSSQCNYKEIVDLLYRSCELWRNEGKRFIFFRFDNTVDVRRAYEALVLRAPGEQFVPAAILTVARLRRDEGLPLKAVEVYGNLRNIFPKSAESTVALVEEACLRLEILKEKGYNRDRAKDTKLFLEQAMVTPGLNSIQQSQLNALHKEVKELLEEEAWNAAKFYDSPTRTRNSAIVALENFIVENPSSKYVPTARERLAKLKEGAK